MSYFTFFYYTKFLKPGVSFILTAHLYSDETHFKCSVDTRSS